MRSENINSPETKTCTWKRAFTGELRLCHGELTKNPAEMTGMRYKNVNLMSRMQKRMGPIGCLGQIENIKRQSLYYLLVGNDIHLCDYMFHTDALMIH